jgi:carbon-monoxide dehydrogenase large subunit
MSWSNERPSRWVGQRLLRREDARLLQGRGNYVDDFQLPNMLHVRLARSPLAHATIDQCVTERARCMPGVLGVFTIEDVLPTVKPFPNRLPFLRPVTYFPLASERVRFVGDPVAAVVADSAGRAEDAVNEIDLQLTPLPTLASADDALRADAPTLYAEWPDNVSVHRWASFGDVDAAFASADVVVDETFYMGRQSALPLEPRGCVASFDESGLTVWSSTQCPHILRSTLAELLAIPEPRIRVIAPDVGGGFGLKYQIYREEVLVAWLARALRRPVKWREDLREQLASATHSRDKRVRLELAARADGTILGLRASMVVDVGSAMAYPYSYGSTLVLAGGLPLGLRVQNYAYDYRCVVTNKSASGAYRGFGNNMRVFVVDRSIDMLAERLKIDRAEIRRKNLVSRADLPYCSATGTRITSGTVAEALDEALTLAGYADFPTRQEEARQEGRLLGIGMTAFAETAVPSYFGMVGAWGGADSATVRIEPDGNVTALVGLSPQGQGHETIVSQVIADELGIHPDQVMVRHGDTAATPYGLGAWGSRSAVVGGGSAILACDKLRAKIMRIACHLMEMDSTNLCFERGRVRTLSGDGPSLSLLEIARAAYAGRAQLPRDVEPGLEATAFFEPEAIDAAPDAQGRAMRHGTVANQAQVVTVEVDATTGQVAILDYVVVHDCGIAINPMIVDGQIRGAVCQGIAGTLFEEIQYDRAGQLLTGTLLDYQVPTAREIPNVRLAHLESPDLTVPGGFKGMAEGGTIGAPAAIANAIADALKPFGAHITATPLTPMTILGLINKGRADDN